MRKESTLSKEEPEMKFRAFTITGAVYSGNEDHAKHTLFWAIRNSAADTEILLKEINIEGEQNA